MPDALPIENYDDQKAEDIVAAFANPSLSDEDVFKVQAYEAANKNRSTVVGWVRPPVEGEAKVTVQRLVDDSFEILGVSRPDIVGAFHDVDRAEEVSISVAKKRVAAWRKASDSTTAPLAEEA